jgi:uncharacterized protein YbaR (Trm112 family)
MHDSFLVDMHALELLSIVVPAMVRHEEDEEVDELVGGGVLILNACRRCSLDLRLAVVCPSCALEGSVHEEAEDGSSLWKAARKPFYRLTLPVLVSLRLEQWFDINDGWVPNECTR